jgi:hypothetical protein
VAKDAKVLLSDVRYDASEFQFHLFRKAQEQSKILQATSLTPPAKG